MVTKSGILQSSQNHCEENLRSPIIMTGLNDQYEADLPDMQKLSEENRGVRFLLIVIDILSRYLWVETLSFK